MLSPDIYSFGNSVDPDQLASILVCVDALRPRQFFSHDDTIPCLPWLSSNSDLYLSDWILYFSVM